MVPNNDGWICPKCKRVYGPHVDECRKCNTNAQSPTLVYYGNIPDDMTTNTIWHRGELLFVDYPKSKKVKK